MKKFNIIILLLVPLAAMSQFGEKIIIDQNGEGVQEFITQDINNDGFKDILLAQNGIFYFENEGSGVFGEKVAVTGGVASAWSIAGGDFNNDGWKDMVVATANFQNSELYLILNDNGQMQSEILLDSGLFFNTKVKATDIDNDGDVDIILATDIELIVYNNNGNANFTKTLVVPGIVTEYYTIEVIDIDNDNYEDVIVGGTKAIIYKNINGVLTFDEARTNFIANNDGLVFLVNTNDFNGDGITDLLINDANGNEIKWYSNDGLGNFSFENIIDPNFADGISMATADYNGDGNIDLLTVVPHLFQVIWYQNDGAGNFGNRIIIDAGSLFTNAVCSEDLDNDDLPDIIWSSESINVQLNNSDLLSIVSNNFNNEIKIFPNPSSAHIGVTGIKTSAHYSIYDVLGNIVKEGIIFKGEKIDISNLLVGVYFLKFENKNSLIFIKN